MSCVGRRDKALVARFSSASSNAPPSEKKEELRTLYPSGKILAEGTLKVDDVHTLYFREYGSPNATKTALFLHGGPGAACFPNHARFFDPEKYRVVLFDQRGCGSSTPRGTAVDNDTWKLVSDCEALRTNRSVDVWDVVLGGSWGVTLAIAYAQEHPDRVKGIILRGVCLMRHKEVCWLFGPDGGASSLAPRAYASFLDKVPVEERGSCRSVLNSYKERLFGNDTKIRDEAARAWSSWEFQVSGLNVAQRPASNDTEIQGRVLEWNGTEWLVDGVLEAEVERQARARMMERFQEQKRQREAEQNKTAANSTESASAANGTETVADSNSTNAPAAAASDVKSDANASGSANKTAAPQGSSSAPAQAMLTCLYSAEGAFMEDGLLLRADRIQRIHHIPCIAIQGASDLICPPVTAYDLHTAWPEMRLKVVKGAGHSMYDPRITSELVKATDSFLAAAQTQTEDG